MEFISSIPCSSGVVSVDWLAFSCRLAHPRPFSDVELGLQTPSQVFRIPECFSVLRMSMTNVWGERWFVMDSFGNKVATILCSPRSPRIAPDRCLVEIANRFLYYDSLPITIDMVMDMLPMSIEGLNRVDLCCDFMMDKRMWKVYEGLSRGDCYVKALKSGAVWWQGIQGKDRLPHCMTFGGLESRFKWKVYYKYLELMQAPPESKKDYIMEMWRRMQFDEEKVWRIEVSISDTKKLCDSTGRRIPPADWYLNKAQLFCDLYADKFVVRRAEGHRDKRNDTVETFLDIRGMKNVKHALPIGSYDSSDPEKRVVCKVWQELHNVDTLANDTLSSYLREVLRGLCERETNIWALQRMYNASMDDIARCCGLDG